MTISTAQIFTILDSLESVNAPRVFRVRLWGERVTSSVVGYSPRDVRARVHTMRPDARIASITETGDRS